MRSYSNSIHIYLYSAFYNTHHFKAALQKMHVYYNLEWSVIREDCVKLCIWEMYIYKSQLAENELI